MRGFRSEDSRIGFYRDNGFLYRNDEEYEDCVDMMTPVDNLLEELFVEDAYPVFRFV